MTNYGSPITCSVGTLSGCDCEEYYPLGDPEEEAIRRALELMKNPPNLGRCKEYGVERFLDCYTGNDPREFQPGIPVVVDIRTGEIVDFSDDDSS